MFSFIKKKDEYTNLTMMGGGDGEPLFATIDVTSYSCFNIIKRTDRRDIILKSLFWRFVDTGVILIPQRWSVYMRFTFLRKSREK